MMTAPTDDVVFSCPTIAPKVYIVKGPSGWPETFSRAALDEELVRFLHPVAPRELAELFLTMRETADKQDLINWFTVVGYLGRVQGASPRSIPHTVGIAFWAQIELARRERATN